MLDSADEKFRAQLALLQIKYDELLNKFDMKTIQKVIQVLEERRECAIQRRENKEGLDEKTQRIFDLMKAYAEEIKNIFIRSGGTLTHITDVSPENMSKGKISRSPNKLNHYETQRGNWVFASSSPSERNPYIARKRDGMISF